MIELRWITCSTYDKNGNYVPETKQLQYRVKSPSGFYAGMAPPADVTSSVWTKWRPIPDVEWDWDYNSTETK